MTLIAILISLALERYVRSLEDYRRFDWFFAFAKWVHSRLETEDRHWDANLVILAILIPLLLVLWLVIYLLGEIHGFFAFVVGVVVLYFSQGPKNLREDVQGYIDAKNRGDTEGALLHAEAVIGPTLPENESDLARTMTKSALVQTSERLLSVIFWFIILGPIGAALYRLSSLLQGMAHERAPENGFASAAIRLHFILMWIPARLIALSYAIGGSFVQTFDNWQDFHPGEGPELFESNETLLVQTGLGALEIPSHAPAGGADLEEIHNALNLGSRAIIVWITILALMTLAGWAS